MPDVCATGSAWPLPGAGAAVIRHRHRARRPAEPVRALRHAGWGRGSAQTWSRCASHATSQITRIRWPPLIVMATSFEGTSGRAAPRRGGADRDHAHPPPCTSTGSQRTSGCPGYRGRRPAMPA